MTATQEVETLLSSQELPAELMRPSTSTHQTEETQIACTLSGMVVTRYRDDVICPLMLRRNLIVPAHHGLVAQSVWRMA